MEIMFFIGAIALIFGLLFIFVPKFVQKLNEIGNIIITTDETTIAHRYITGGLLVIVSIVIFYYALQL